MSAQRFRAEPVEKRRPEAVDVRHGFNGRSVNWELPQGAGLVSSQSIAIASRIEARGAITSRRRTQSHSSSPPVGWRALLTSQIFEFEAKSLDFLLGVEILVGLLVLVGSSLIRLRDLIPRSVGLATGFAGLVLLAPF